MKGLELAIFNYSIQRLKKIENVNREDVVNIVDDECLLQYPKAKASTANKVIKAVCEYLNIKGDI